MLIIKIDYNGEFPNLCKGNLKAMIGDQLWDFGKCLKSGGGVWISSDGKKQIGKGKWGITDWPENFPEEYEKEILDKINKEIKHGCCGGCI